MFKRVATAIWGEFESKEEVQKFVLLAFVFFLIIGTYWSLRPMKDSIFNAIVGAKDWLWLAKIVSLCVISPLVILYGKLIDAFSRHKVFYALIAIYSVLALCFAWAFMQPGLGLTNLVQSPHRYLGWMWYVYVESYGSLIVALFWAFTADTTKPDSARRGFPIIALFGQLGNILGPKILNTRFMGFANSAPLVAICAGIMVLTGVAFWFFMRVTPENQLTGYEEKTSSTEKKAKPGFAEGLKLMLTKPYLLSIFLIITFYEIIVTVIDFHFKQTVFAVFPDEGTSQAYLSDYASWVGVVATGCVLLGINNIQRRLGMTTSLIILPLLVAGAIITIYLNPTALNVAMWIMVLSKAINYALNQPTLKQLYIPTSKDSRYKAQAWIEMFGSRGSKATASFWNSYRSVLGVNLFITISTFLSLGIIGGWVMIALFVARTYNTAIEENKVVC